MNTPTTTPTPTPTPSYAAPSCAAPFLAPSAPSTPSAAPSLETAQTVAALAPSGDYRPSFAIYHPNSRGTGCAIQMDLRPAGSHRDGCIMLRLANQKSVGDRRATTPVFPTFDWERAICVKLDFSDLCKMLQVFRGECETLEDGKGLYHRSAKYATRIVLRHLLEPVAGYSLEVYRNTPGNPDADCASHILLNTWEALGIAIAFENSIGAICFGIPKPQAELAQAETQGGRDARAA